MGEGVSMSSRKAIERTLKKLVGRTIVAVEPHAFRTDNAGTTARDGWTSDPVLVLDDGSRVWFVVDETETGEYGISVSVGKPTDVRSAGSYAGPADDATRTTRQTRRSL